MLAGKKMAEILLKMGFLGSKSSKDEKFKSWNYWETIILKIIWKQKFGKLFLKSRMMK